MLGRILIKEVDNTGRIHLFYCRGSDRWAAFQQSALNLVEIVPEFVDIITDEVFVEGKVKLTCITINREMMEFHGLPFYCTLLGDDYMELQKTPVADVLV
ncbi:hypothetical protein J8K89_07000 [Bacteroides fragilis]|uniref:hypothetical protein n=1 Tax=Bacteroides fragilis TaxID=817 RepID=UPI002030D138|nr:hypothetical protein [Bacteroides fragilis]MCM0322789.1 hypothetical protein [Bacteroides fragilis]